jgi:hypothetical protein
MTRPRPPISLVLLAVLISAALGSVGCKDRRSTPPPEEARAETPVQLPERKPAPPAYPPAPTVGFAGDLEWKQPVEAADLARVDIAGMYAQARHVAERLQQGAQFVGLVAFEIRGGVANMAGESRVMYHFEFKGTDPSKPPGKDAIEYRIDVEAQQGVLTGSRRAWSASRLGHHGALEAPACNSAKMWQVAMGSGVPSNAVATIHFYDNTPFSPKSPAVWSVRVEGHDEHRREIDGKTCAVVKNWGTK